MLVGRGFHSFRGKFSLYSHRLPGRGGGAVCQVANFWPFPESFAPLAYATWGRRSDRNPLYAAAGAGTPAPRKRCIPTRFASVFHSPTKDALRSTRTVLLTPTDCQRRLPGARARETRRLARAPSGAGRAVRGVFSGAAARICLARRNGRPRGATPSPGVGATPADPKARDDRIECRTAKGKADTIENRTREGG